MSLHAIIISIDPFNRTLKINNMTIIKAQD